MKEFLIVGNVFRPKYEHTYIHTHTLMRSCIFISVHLKSLKTFLNIFSGAIKWLYAAKYFYVNCSHYHIQRLLYLLYVHLLFCYCRFSCSFVLLYFLKYARNGLAAVTIVIIVFVLCFLFSTTML